MVVDPGEGGWVVPKLRFGKSRFGWVATGRLVGGLTPEHFAARVPSLVHAWRAYLISVDSPKRGRVRLTALRRDPLAEPISALPISRWPDLTALPLGWRDDGHPWLLRLLGRHVLIAGATGSGKSSVQWSLLRALCPLIRAGVVEVWTADPKRMEFAAGGALFARYEYEAATMVEMVEEAAEVMTKRADRLAGARASTSRPPGSR